MPIKSERKTEKRVGRETSVVNCEQRKVRKQEKMRESEWKRGETMRPLYPTALEKSAVHLGSSRQVDV
jgi:hypothetical protein